MGEETVAGPDSSDMDDSIQYSHAGGEAKKEEKRRFQSAANMLDGGVVTKPISINPKGVGKGGGLKGAFEHDDANDAPPAQEYAENRFAGGTANEKEEYGEEPMPRMMAGGEAALPEDKEFQEDPGVDPDASFVAEFLKARKAKASAPGR